MGKWVAGGANKLTLLRIPCMFLFLAILFGPGPEHLGWYWLGALLFTIGMILDGLDGYYARHWQPGGATREGKFLDQFVDKWGFVYPVFVGLIVALDLVVPWHFVAGLAALLVLDFVSCRRHYRDYLFTVQVQRRCINQFGAINFGKIKFFAQNLVICLLVAGQFPVSGWQAKGWAAAFADVVSGPDAWWLELTRLLAKIGSDGRPVAYVLLWAAVLLACLSLRKRAEIGQQVRQEVEEELETQPI